MQLGELYFHNAMKRYLRTQQQINAQNSENNAKVQQASYEAKVKGDNELEDKKNQAKERQILLSGAFDLLKAGVEIPASLQPVMEGVIVNLSMPLMVENEQMKQGIIQMKQQQMQEQANGMIPQEDMPVQEQLQQTA